MRARQTKDLVLDVLDYDPEVRLVDGLYNFGDGTGLLHIIQQIGTECSELMIIGHNPSLENLAVKLAGTGPSADLKDMARKYPTAALAIIEFEADDWADIRDWQGQAAQLYPPQGPLRGLRRPIGHRRLPASATVDEPSALEESAHGRYQNRCAGTDERDSMIKPIAIQLLEHGRPRVHRCCRSHADRRALFCPASAQWRRMGTDALGTEEHIGDGFRGQVYFLSGRNQQPAGRLQQAEAGRGHLHGHS